VRRPSTESSESSERLAAAAESQEFLLRDEEFERICRLIYQRAGITLAPSKRTMVYSRLARRLRALGDNSFAQYLRRLDRNEADEWEQFVNALTTNLTSFYREPHHFEILREHLARRKSQRKLRIWCSAASTGEEPYTLAFTAIEAFGTLQPPIEIIATDIDTHVLEKARRGVYPIDSIKALPAERVAQFFRRGVGQNAGMVRVRSEVAALVSFSQLNLLDGNWPIGHDFTAIFCRNVMIYFDRATQLAILERMAPRLAPDGLFFAGHSENLSHARTHLLPQGQTVYRLAPGVAPMPARAI
jgi:chemotaxis protein methyltransferase CheR